MPRWDPGLYERFKAERDRPALDLMVQIPADLHPRLVWDLGCGTGEHAALLSRRHPMAEVHGLDASAEMLARARARPEAVDWREGDIAAFAPERPPDLIFTNAALQWLGDHESLFPRLVGALAPGGVFACQVPVTHEEVWHRRLRELAAETPFKAHMLGVRDVRPVASPRAYYEWLSPLADLDIWSTTYLHVLRGEDPVVEWMSGTGLRPYLERLSEGDLRRAFLDRYRAMAGEDFPRSADGTTLFPFPRLFILARRR